MAIHSGCLFHFNQVILRKIKALGLSNDYLQNEGIRDYPRKQKTGKKTSPSSTHDGAT